MQKIITRATGRTRRVIAASLVFGSLMSFAMGQQLAHRTDAASGVTRRPLLQAEHRPAVSGAIGTPFASMPSQAVRALPLAALSSGTSAASDAAQHGDNDDTKHASAKHPHSYASPEHANPSHDGGNGQGGND